MADSRFIKVILQGESNGRNIDLKEIRVCRQTRVAQLKDYITEVLCYKGSLYLDKKMVYQMSTLAQLKIDDGGILKLNKYLILSKKLRDLHISTLPQEEQHTIQVPTKIKVQLLKFVIECELGILIPHQALGRGNQRWDPNDTHECTIAELQGLSVKDISKRVHTPQTNSPKNRDVQPFLSLCEYDAAESSGSDSNLGYECTEVDATKQDTATTKEDGATKDGTKEGTAGTTKDGIEESQQPSTDSTKPEYINRKKLPQIDRSHYVYQPMKSQQTLPRGDGSMFMRKKAESKGVG